VAQRGRARDVSNRSGLRTQIWLVDAFLARRITPRIRRGCVIPACRPEPAAGYAENERLDIAASC